MSKYLDRDAILSAEDLGTEEVEVPEWGGAVQVRGLTGAERDSFEQEVATESEDGAVSNFRAKLIVRCAVDDDGNRLFKNADVKALGQKSGQALNRVAEVAMRLSGMREQDVEELAGN